MDFLSFFEKKKDERCYEILKNRKIIKVEESIKKASLSYMSFRHSLLHAMAGASRRNNEKQNHTLIPSTVVSIVPFTVVSFIPPTVVPSSTVVSFI